MKIASIHQSHYLPWFGLLDKIAKSDVHIVLDNVQYNKRSFQHRTLYSTTVGEKYLSLSVLSKGSQVNGVEIRDVEIANDKIIKKHWTTLEQRYRKSPGWSFVRERLYDIYHKNHVCMLDINMDLLRLTLDVYQIQTQIKLSSEFKTNSVKGELMYELTKMSGCDTYLSGNGAKEYMDEVPVEVRTCDVIYQDFKHPVYKQRTGLDFKPGMFALEMFLEEGDSAIGMFECLSKDPSRL